jgi:hypothetical protein
VLSSRAELKKERTLQKERTFPWTSFRKKKVLSSKGESTCCTHRIGEKYGSGRKGSRSFEAVLHYNTMDMISTQKTRIGKVAVRATRYTKWAVVNHHAIG